LTNILDPQLLAEVLKHAPDGVAVLGTGPGAPRIDYWNSTLAALLRRPEEWLEQRALEEIEAEAPADPTQTSAGVGMRVRLKRADGSQVECERWAVMLPRGAVAMYYRPLPRRAPGALAAALERSSALITPEHLTEVLRRDWSIGQRDGRTLTMMLFDVDALKEYQEVFGRGAGENVVRQVGRTLATAMKRASDVVARRGDDTFAALGVGMDPGNACRHAEQIVERIRSLAIHHPRSPTGRYLTVSAGVVTATPARDLGADALLHAAQEALKQAKAAGGNRALQGTL
jgi:diguanylate cyclase (GGDEF)-like protein